MEKEIAVLNERVESLERRVSTMESNDSILQELKTAIEILAVTNDSQNKQIEQQSVQFEKFGESMERINTNLTNLDMSQKLLHNEVERVNHRMGKVEEHQESSKIDPASIAKQVIVTFLVGLGVFAIGFLFMQSGMK